MHADEPGIDAARVAWLMQAGEEKDHHAIASVNVNGGEDKIGSLSLKGLRTMT
jgi:hypothetical protein